MFSPTTGDAGYHSRFPDVDQPLGQSLMEYRQSAQQDVSAVQSRDLGTPTNLRQIPHFHSMKHKLPENTLRSEPAASSSEDHYFYTSSPTSPSEQSLPSWHAVAPGSAPAPRSPRWSPLANSSQLLVQGRYYHPNQSGASIYNSSNRVRPQFVSTVNPFEKQSHFGPFDSPTSLTDTPTSQPLVGASLAPDTGHGKHHRPLTPTSSARKGRLFERGPGTADGPAMTVDNFSRPRKPSSRQSNKDSPLLYPRQFGPGQSEADDYDISANYATPDVEAYPARQPRRRGLSISSTRTTNTASSSSLPYRPSLDRLATADHGGRPKEISYFANPPTSQLPNDKTGRSSIQPQDASPPVTSAGDELRSSFRSQLTVSTAQAALFTPTSTERSSVFTKTSSVAESSIIHEYTGGSMNAEDDLSVEDVMGLYEQGFADDSGDDGDDVTGTGSREETSTSREIDVRNDYDSSQRRRALADVGSRGVRGDRNEEVVNLSCALPPLDLPTPSFSPVPGRELHSPCRSPLFSSSVPENIGAGLSSERPTATKGLERVHAGVTNQPSRQSEEEAPSTTVEHTRQGDVFDEQIRSESPSSRSHAPAGHPSTTSSTLSSSPSPPGPQEPLEDPSSRDRYGFRKENAYITREQYDRWDASYSEYLARRRKKWIAYLKDNSLMTERPNRFPPRSAKTKRFIRKGIPPDWRGAAWFYYAGGPAILAKHAGVYDDLVKRAGLDRDRTGVSDPNRSEVKQLVADDIEKDLHRTFPDNARFKPPRYARTARQPLSQAMRDNSEATVTGESQHSGQPLEEEPQIISSLRRVLYAFALYNPRIGYCQSLNFLAGLLLLFVENEEQAFWLLNVITRVYLPGTHEVSLEGSKVDLGVFMTALKDALPQVWKQIAGDEDNGPPRPSRMNLRVTRGKQPRSASLAPGGKNAANDPNRLPAITLCMTAWFMSCFIGTLPIETVLRVWDMFFYEGSRTLFRIALTIFKIGESEIKAVADPMEMFGVVQALPRRMLDCNALMEACYKRRNGIGHLSQESVDEKRKERRDGIRRWKTEQEAAVAAEEPSGANVATSGRLAQSRADAPVHFADTDVEGEVRRKGTLFGRRKYREKTKAMQDM
ncbi:hypothetical protein VTK73DRAFT_6855 [Phialemonium thermophilum]|uniref:Rab-GAP TBC domain-containing protein n=1 Tax=Phialemonium thermophilum TaxID=223376 RepID=A0ABR3XVH4_9PEZI